MSASRDDLFLRNCAGEVTDIKPVWIMRQAGRYLSEYREVRAKFPNFIDFYKNPEASCEVTLQPIDKFGLDAAILFSDILTLLPVSGSDLEFIPGKGPTVHNPIRTLEDTQKLRQVDVEKDLHFVFDAVKLIRKKLDGRVPLIGFAGGPLTVASYMIEGGSSKELGKTKQLLFHTPAAYHALMEHLTQITIQYLQLQVEAGAQVICVMDSWAGHFSPTDYQESIAPYTQRIFKALKETTNVPLVHYANGASALLQQFTGLGADVLGLDWRADLGKAIQDYPEQMFQGNLDPCTLYAPDDIITAKTQDILELVKDRPHIMNLGHGVLPDIPVRGVECFLKTIRS